MKKIIFSFLALMVIAGCATHRYAYTETPLGDNSYKIISRGNPFTAPPKVQNKFFRRCAELTLDGGYKYFTLTPVNEVVAAKENEPSQGFDFRGPPLPQRTYILKMFNSKQKGAHMYDARTIYNSLASRRMIRRMEERTYARKYY